MASPVLRQAIYARYLASSVLTGLGFTEPNIYPNFSPDAPQGKKFMVIRWGATARGIGPVNRVSLQCWVYNREPDYLPIANALLEIRRILLPLAGLVMAPGEAIVSVDYEGDSDDLYDDGYRAYTRWTSHTITASGS